jgi:MFS family permease
MPLEKGYYMIRKRDITLISMYLLISYSAIQLNMLNVFGLYLMRLFNINQLQFGLMSSLYFYVNLLLLLSGFLLDFLRPKNILGGVIIISISGLLLFLAFQNIYGFILWRVTGGLLGAFSITGPIKIISEKYPMNKIGVHLGMVSMVFSLSNFIVPFPLSWSFSRYGFYNTILFIMIYGIIILILLAISCNNFNKKTGSTIRNNLIFKPTTTHIMAAIFICFINLPIFVLGGLWGNTYLATCYRFDNHLAAIATSMMFIGHAFGGPLFGFSSTKLKQPFILLLIGALMGILSTLLINSLHTFSNFYILPLFFLLGISTSTQVVISTYLIKNNKLKNTGKLMSFIFAFSILGGAIFQPIFGWIAKNGNNAYSYHNAMYTLTITFVIALIISPFFKKSNEKVF